MQASAQGTQSTHCSRESHLDCSSSLFLILECLSSWKVNTNVHFGFGSEMVVFLFKSQTHDEQSDLHSCSGWIQSCSKAYLQRKLRCVVLTMPQTSICNSIHDRHKLQRHSHSDWNLIDLWSLITLILAEKVKNKPPHSHCWHCLHWSEVFCCQVSLSHSC